MESARSAGLWQRGQSTPSPDRLIGRNSSNLDWQPEQMYSYIGIFYTAILALGQYKVNAASRLPTPLKIMNTYPVDTSSQQKYNLPVR